MKRYNANSELQFIDRRSKYNTSVLSFRILLYVLGMIYKALCVLVAINLVMIHDVNLLISVDYEELAVTNN